MTFWQHRILLTWLLAPLSLLFWLITGLRHAAYRVGLFKSHRARVPVLVVGNLSVGGNGKTPVVIWAIEQCQQMGLKVGVISRGYGSQAKQFPLRVTPESDPLLAGDEPLLIAQRTGAPVAISPNRAESIALLCHEADLDLIIADDGLQHYALQRDIEWVVIDGVRRFGNGFLMPAGPLRELPSRLKNVNARICNGGTPHAGEHLMTLTPRWIVNLKSGEKIPLAHFHEKRINACAGIGNPQRFFTLLATLGFTLQKQTSFADHQAFSPEKLADFDAEIPLLMTEKDAVKCRQFAQENWFYLPVDAQFDDASTQQLRAQLQRLVTSRHAH